MSVKDFDEYVREALANLSTESSDENTSDEEMHSATTSSIPQLLMERYDQRTEPFENFTIRLEAFFELQNIPQEKKVKALISLLHPNLFSLVRNWLYPQNVDKLNYEELKCKLTELLNLKPRVIPSRRTFFNRKQAAGESISQYVNELRKLIGDCQYPSGMMDMMLRDVFVSGIRSQVILNGLLEQDNISLESSLQLAESLEKKERDGQNKLKSNPIDNLSDIPAVEDESRKKSQPGLGRAETQRCGDFDEPSSSQVQGGFFKPASPGAKRFNQNSSDAWNTQSKMSRVSRDSHPWGDSDDSFDSWDEPLPRSCRYGNNSDFCNSWPEQLWKQEEQSWKQEEQSWNRQGFRTSGKPSLKSNNPSDMLRSSTTDSWNSEQGTSRQTGSVWPSRGSFGHGGFGRGGIGRGSGRLRNWDITPINLSPNTSSANLPPYSNQSNTEWRDERSSQSANNVSQNLSNSNESNANRNDRSSIPDARNRRIGNRLQTVSNTSSLMRTSGLDEWENIPVNLSTSPTNDLNVNLSTTQGTNSADSQNSLGPSHSRANINASESSQPSTSGSVTNVPSFRNSSTRNPTESVSNGRSNLLNMAKSCYTPVMTPHSIPMKGHQTQTCEVILSGSTVEKYCVVTLDWYMSTDHTEEGTLQVSSCDSGNLILSLNLSEVKGIFQLKRHDDSTSLLLHTFNDKDDKHPLVIRTGFRNILDHIFIVWERIRKMPTMTRKSIWATKENGDFYVAEIDSLGSRQQTISGRYLKEYDLNNSSNDSRMTLPNGLPWGAEITIHGRAPTNSDRFHVNLICGHNQEIALHFNPRFSERVFVRNSHIKGEWGTEERNGYFNIIKDFTLCITCMEKKFRIIVNSTTYIYYNHRVSPQLITDIQVGGEVIFDGVLYECSDVIIEPQDLFWKKKGSDLLLMKTCSKGITWGINTSGMPVVYLDKSDGAGYLLPVLPIKMKDLTVNVVDNQPIAVWAIDEKGQVFSRRGVTIDCVKGTRWEHIPTDQPTRMISIDGEGKQIWCCGENGTCYVRCGDWWAPVESKNGCTFRKVAVGKGTVWALDDEGDLYVRNEISRSSPLGEYWSRVSNNDNNKFQHVHINGENVWAVTELGVICRRMGITFENPEGVAWSHGDPQNWIHVCEK